MKSCGLISLKNNSLKLHDLKTCPHEKNKIKASTLVKNTHTHTQHILLIL